MEAPANFQQKEKELEILTDGSCSDYINFFQDLKNYYYRNKLIEQGMVFIPLNERIIKAKDPYFLTCMLDYYLTLKDFENALKLLERLRETGYSASSLAVRQKSLGASLARRDATITGIENPWDILDSYTGSDKWYREFKRSYKINWLKSTNWKMKYWPFIWKK
jgi:pentatricopeptide repeat protein